MSHSYHDAPHVTSFCSRADLARVIRAFTHPPSARVKHIVVQLVAAICYSNGYTCSSNPSNHATYTVIGQHMKYEAVSIGSVNMAVTADVIRAVQLQSKLRGLTHAGALQQLQLAETRVT